MIIMFRKAAEHDSLVHLNVYAYSCEVHYGDQRKAIELKQVK